MVSGAADPFAGSSSDERDLGWGGREWADGRRNDDPDNETDTGGETDTDPTDPDVERLRADRPPHHEERER